MRLGVDLHAIQAPSCRGRGIGRYAKSLLRAIVLENTSWDFVFYYRADLELDWDEELDPKVTEWVAVEADPPGQPDGTLQQLVQKNPHDLDWLLIPNPVVERRGFAIPESVPWGPRLAAIVYDLIPALFPKHYLDDAKVAAEYFQDLRRLQTYDLLLAISEATQRDTQRLLQIPENRVANIQAATDRRIFQPASQRPADLQHDSHVLDRHGIDNPFLYYLGNVDWRKNTIGLVDIFAQLPSDLRKRHQLVLTCQNNAWFLERLKNRIEDYGIEDSVILTGPVSDDDVRAFYRRTELFLFPSYYEGFGLPLLEAMCCGAAVVAADNSSQPEVVGPAGVLAQTGNSADWALKITEILRSPTRIAEMRQASLKQATCFTWEKSAWRLCEAIDNAKLPERRGNTPPLGIVPYPSVAGSGFDAGSGELFQRLCESWAPVVFYDVDRVGDLPPCPMQVAWHHKKLMGRIRPIIGNPPLLYLVDTLECLTPLLDDLRRFPGVVAFCNATINDWSHLVPQEAAVSPEHSDPRPVEEALRQLIYHAKAVVCHSEWLHARLSQLADHGQTTPIYRINPSTVVDLPVNNTTSEFDAEHVYARLLRAS